MEQKQRQTNAMRQASYRQRHLLEGTGERLNFVVTVSAKRQLERLARHYGVTQRQMLEQLLSQADRNLVETLHGSELTAYYDSVTR